MLFKQPCTEYSQVSLSDQSFEHTSKSSCNLSFPFSFCKAKGTRLVHMMRVTSAPTRSRDRHLTFPLPRPRRHSKKSREKPPYYQNFGRLPRSYWEEGVARRSARFRSVHVHGPSRGFWGLPESEHPSLENGGGVESEAAVISSETWRGGRRPSPKRPRGREEPRAERPGAGAVASAGAGAPSSGLGGGRDPSLEATFCASGPHCVNTDSSRDEAPAPLALPGTAARGRSLVAASTPGLKFATPGRSFRSPRVTPLLPAKSAPRSGEACAGLTVIFLSRLLHLHPLPGVSPAHPPPPTWSLPRRACACETRGGGEGEEGGIRGGTG